MGFFTGLKQTLKAKFEYWLIKRIPKNSTQTLSGRNIFIFPSKFGFAYLFFVLLLFILGTNYQNNLIILLSYLLASVFMTAMLQSYRNLSNLTLSAKTNTLRGFAETSLDIPISLETNKERMAYQLFFQSKVVPSENIIKQNDFLSKETCLIPIKLEKRGLFSLPRLILQSYYGLGLFRCWTSVDLNISVLIYPKPERPPQINIDQLLSNNRDVNSDDLSNETLTIKSGADEFNELIPYKQGESLAKVAWKQVARGQGWYTKNYDSVENNTPNWLTLDALPKAPIEQQLRWLSYLIVELQKREQVFGLLLHTKTIAPDKGISHSHLCLKEIALYG
ncbi:DUF58 domain-containing protein [Thalassotalea profundi]|uniref:DUF58 domain-containing protein n=1 Tax=Thalassotalea profundi TaxID=2036687 RepID=A0ABQ3IQ21_9GAMM|nr:DUF58 domain-containing protein [Thalassotalea profundi]GHE91089.1 DUF58 domain-containing protein [Thalassotalea profundi]